MAATRFANDFGLPQIMALQEIENLNVLRRIATDLRKRYGTEYRAVLIPGNDISSSNIGFLVQDGLRIARIEQLFHEQRFGNRPEPLFSRPPLLLEVCRDTRCVSLLNLHLRSMRGIDKASQSERVARKRRQQAETVALWVHRFQQQKPRADLLLLGDFNALTPADAHVDIAGILLGSPDNSQVRLRARDLLDPDLIDLTRRIPPDRRYSYIFRQRRQQLDYMFSNAALASRVEHIAYSPVDYGFSDHAGLLARFSW
jgi:endonuclease/exonuclease/phosphatase family metal-dependent hydrolase